MPLSNENDIQKYRVIVDNVNSIILKIDKNAHVTFINDYAQHFFGFDEEEILGKHLIGTIVPKFDSNGNNLEEMVEGVFNSESTRDYWYHENENICKNGRRVWISWRNKVFYDKNNEISEILAVGVDATERHNAELELVKKHQITNALLNVTDYFVLLIDKDGILLEMNDSTAKRLKHTKEELLGKCAYDFIPPELIKTRKAANERVFETKKPYKFVDESNGLILENRIYPVIDSKGEVYQVAIYSKNITEEKIAEQKLKESEEQFRRISERVPIMTYNYVLYPNGSNEFLYVSPNCEEILELKDFELLNNMNLFWEIVHPDDLQRLHEEDVRANKENNFFKADVRIITKSGKTKCIQIASRPNNLKHMNANIWSGYVLDISTDKKIQNDLNYALAAKDKFFSIISHDLRSPFNSLLGFSDILLTCIEDEDYEDFKTIATNIKETANKTYSLLENLLMWANSQQNNLTFSPKNHLINDIIKEEYILLKHSSIQKRIVVSLNLDTDTYVFADKNMISTVIRNLLSNAIKFTPENGTVTVNSVKKNNYLEIEFVDTGIGLDKEQLENLFKLEHINSTRGTKGERGSGLGLLLCKDFIEKNKGTISVESKVGEGSTFKVSLPLQ